MEIKRTLFEGLASHLSAKEITLLVGPRQAGKTTLLSALLSRLEGEGSRCFFFNLDYQPDFQLFENQQKLVEYLALASGRQRAYVFIDEIQRKENAGLFLKGIYDLGLPYKFIVSGSGSLELKEKIHESLAGRKRIFELSTLSFEEFADYRTRYQFSGKLSQFLALHPEKAETLLLEYLNFGGYPRVVLEQSAREKVLVLQEIYQSYLEKDIQLLLQLEKSQAFVTMMRLLAVRIGQQLDYSALSRDAGLSFSTLKNYLWYAEKTFVLSLITPFFRNKEKEIAKAPQAYYRDLGLRNIALETAGRISSLKDTGFLFQNFVYSLLRQKLSDTLHSIHYWRTKGQAEVDFVVDKALNQLPVEIKASRLKQPEVSRSLRSFLIKYRPPEAWVVNRALSASVIIENTEVRFIPWHQLLAKEV